MSAPAIVTAMGGVVIRVAAAAETWKHTRVSHAPLQEETSQDLWNKDDIGRSRWYEKNLYSAAFP